MRAGKGGYPCQRVLALKFANKASCSARATRLVSEKVEGALQGDNILGRVPFSKGARPYHRSKGEPPDASGPPLSAAQQLRRYIA